MNVKAMAAAALLVPATLMAAPRSAEAAIHVFTGTRSNVNLINAPGTGRCAPMNTVNIAPGALSSTGSSNLGAFASTQSHCIPGAPSMATPTQPITDGLFTYAFASGDTLFGTYTGTASLNAGVVTGMESLIVQGGTGLFLDASGFINALGTLRFAPNPQGIGFVGIFDGTVDGVLDLPAIPEPATWAMMIGGFGMAGAALRRKRRLTAVA